MRARRVLGAAILVVVAAAITVALVFGGVPGGCWPAGVERPSLTGRGVPVVAVVRIEGQIESGRGVESLFETTVGSDTVVGYLDQASSDPEVRAVVLRLNSPGGSAAGSQEIAAALERLRDAGKVTVASMGDIAASGAYWVATACDEVFADPGTLTGSIGVIMEIQNLEELYRKLGVATTTIKSGPYKDIGSSTRSLTSAEQDILQSMIDDVYSQFVDAVAANRGMPRARVVELADGRVFTGRQALAADLVDHLGGLLDATERAADLAGAVDAYAVREYGAPGAFELFLRWLGVQGWEGVAGAAGAAGDGGWGPWGALRRLLMFPLPGA